MSYPHTLIFVDLASDDPAAAGKFYSEVFGWRDDDRPMGLYHRMVPGGNFLKSDGTESEIGNLHLGIFKAANARPHPDPEGAEPRELSQSGRKPRVWILVSDDEPVDAILDRAVARGATILWRDHYWSTFNGLNHAFADPWGNEIILWVKAGPEPKVPEGYTSE
jgi:predicted enzyme related to lactoylglutathione lyase